MDADTKTNFLAEVMKGRSVRDICADDGMPSRSKVYEELAEDPIFADQYARACVVRADEIFDELFAIADDKEEAPDRSRIRIDARKWALSKMQPKKYGDKLDVTSDGKQIEGVTMTFVAPKAADG